MIGSYLYIIFFTSVVINRKNMYAIKVALDNFFNPFLLFKSEFEIN